MALTQQLSELDEPYALPSDAPAALDRDGYIRLRNVLSPQSLTRYEPEITQKVIDLNTMHLPMAERDTYNKAFLQVENLWLHSPLAHEFVFSRRLARLAAELLGVDGVRLYHDQALYKEASGGITPWHADQYYWPLDSDRTITVWIPLQDTPAGMGPLEFATASHHFEFGRDLQISDESERLMQEALGAHAFPTDSSEYALGDLSFHLGWTFHRAGPNTSSTPRRVMTIIYMDADIRVTEPVNMFQEDDRARWMPGSVVGQPPATPFTPVLYRRSSQAVR